MKKNKGFTLIELINVIFILLVIGAILIPTFVAITQGTGSDSSRQVEVITQDQELEMKKDQAPAYKEVESISEKGESNKL